MARTESRQQRGDFAGYLPRHPGVVRVERGDQLEERVVTLASNAA